MGFLESLKLVRSYNEPGGNSLLPGPLEVLKMTNEQFLEYIEWPEHLPYSTLALERLRPNDIMTRYIRKSVELRDGSTIDRVTDMIALIRAPKEATGITVHFHSLDPVRLQTTRDDEGRLVYSGLPIPIISWISVEVEGLKPGVVVDLVCANLAKPLRLLLYEQSLTRLIRQEFQGFFRLRGKRNS